MTQAQLDAQYHAIARTVTQAREAIRLIDACRTVCVTRTAGESRHAQSTLTMIGVAAQCLRADLAWFEACERSARALAEGDR